MNWTTSLASIGELDGATFDVALVDTLERAAAERPATAVRFSAPSFKSFESEEMGLCAAAAFPAFSVTGEACALRCEHCGGALLRSMIPATTPDELDRRVRDMIARGALAGFLLSGGSDRRNEIRYERHYPVLEALKRDHPTLRIAVHSALIDEGRARRMASSGVDTVMMDMIGAPETIRDIYHLDRGVEDFEATLAALTATTMEVVPHIVVGLHHGRLVGEWNALDIVARHATASLVLVVIMPHLAEAGRFVVPDPHEVGRLFATARARLADRDVLLGCARPSGVHKRVLDAYAVMAGFDGIAFPADGAGAVARMAGRPVAYQRSCCAVHECGRGSAAPRAA